MEKIRKKLVEYRVRKELREIEEIYLSTPATSHDRREKREKKEKGRGWGELDEYFKTKK